VFALLLPLAAGGRTSLTFLLLLERVPGSTTLHLTLTNKGSDPIGLVAIRGGDFPITGANVVGGGPAQCLVSGNPATLTCRSFQLTQGKTLTALIATTGTATHAQEAVTNGAEPREIDFFPLEVQNAMPRGTATITLKGHVLTVVGTNTGFVAFKRLMFVTKKAHVIKRVISFRIGKRLQSTGDGRSPCKETESKPPSPPKDIVICNATVSPGAAFFMALWVYVSGGLPGGKIADSLTAYDSGGRPTSLPFGK
jgi:hypothetical protein